MKDENYWQMIKICSKGASFMLQLNLWDYLETNVCAKAFAYF